MIEGMYINPIRSSGQYEVIENGNRIALFNWHSDAEEWIENRIEIRNHNDHPNNTNPPTGY